MDSRYRKFLALAETGSFSAAARRMHVTQPAISLAVSSLEHGLGVRLYLRRKKPVVLTAEGDIVVKAAREMAAITEKMRESLADNVSDETCYVGLIDSVAHLLYSSESTRAMLAGLEVMVDNSRLILRDLSEGKIDVGIITGQPKTLGGGLVSHKLCDEEFIFVTAPEHAPSGVVNQVDDWLATPRESTTYQHFLRLFRRRHLRVTPIFHSSSMELLRDMAISGKGTALLPRHIAQPLIDQGVLTIVRIEPLYRPLWAVTRQDTDASKANPLVTQLSTLLSAAN
jgi:DNA-binding transcriptional LysR family regulator